MIRRFIDRRVRVAAVMAVIVGGCSSEPHQTSLRDSRTYLSLAPEEGTVAGFDSSGQLNAVTGRGAIFTDRQRGAGFTEAFRGTVPLRAVGRSTAVGESGLVIIRQDNGTWVEAPPLTSQTLNAVWDHDQRVIVGDDGVVLHFKDGNWAIEQVGHARLTSIWSSGPDDLWIVAGRTFLHGTPGAWQEVDPGLGLEFQAITGSGRELWAVGKGGAIGHFTGTAWQRVANPNAFDLGTVAILYLPVTAADYEVWAAGDGGVLQWTSSSRPALFDLYELNQRIVGVVAGQGGYNTAATWFYGHDGFVYERARSVVIAD